MTTIKVDKITPGSGTTTTLGDSGDTFTIPAGVTFANSGSSNMGDQVTYCSTTKSASFTAVANKGYFINTSDASPFLNYAVTVASGSLYVVGGTGNAFYLDGSRTMAITLLKGRTYRFTQTDNTNDGHPLIISTSNSTTLGTMQAGIVSSGVSYYLDGASNQTNYTNTTTFNAATTRYIEFQPQATGTYYFACYVHGIQMGGAITSQDLTVTLPSSPTVGTEMIIIDSTGNASTNNIVIGRGGSKIKGLCACATLKTDRVGVRLIYSNASQGWVTITSANETAPVMDQTLYVTATGGTVTTCGDYKVHKFTSDGNFIVSCAGTPSGSAKVDYLVVAGGGGGGSDAGGGGGGGGFRISNEYSIPSPTMSPLVSATGLSVTATTYPITIGGGGTGSTGSPGYPASTSGANTIFSSITSAGGGGGGATASNPALNGGSGGGGGGGVPGGQTGGSGNTPPVTPPQGNNGGNGVPNPSGLASGGGGGAGAVGVNGQPSPQVSGAGGIGSFASPSLAVTCSGTTGPTPSVRYFSGGGGGGNYAPYGPRGVGGSGGGGDGSQSGAATAGTTNTGGGAGGGAGAGGAGANGGSGIVLIRYKYQN
jgi:hypothetical protein